jgi:hypothetical protein
MKFINGIPAAEFISDAELKTEQDLSALAIHGSYQEKLHQFRSDVMRLMMKHNALQDEGSWLVYNHAEENDDGPVIYCPRVDICIATKNLPNSTGKNKYGNQNIRVMLNEAYTTNHGIEYFIIDAIVDTDGDSQYNVGVMPADPVNNGVGVTVPIFFVVQDELTLYTPNGYLPFPHIQQIDEHIIPFGHFTYIEDKFHALSTAYDLLNQVKNKAPFHTSQAN